MFCPNCGANNSIGQKFCRSCGLNLEKTAETLLEQIPSEQIPSAESAKLLRRERNLEKFGNIVFTGFGVVLVTALVPLIYLIIAKVILSGNSVFGGILLIAFLIFAVLMLAYVVFKEDLEEKKQKANPTLKNELAEKRETEKLLEEKPFEPASVTENTTDNLVYAERQTRKLE